MIVNQLSVQRGDILGVRDSGASDGHVDRFHRPVGFRRHLVFPSGRYVVCILIRRTSESGQLSPDADRTDVHRQVANPEQSFVNRSFVGSQLTVTAEIKLRRAFLAHCYSPPGCDTRRTCAALGPNDVQCHTNHHQSV
jgi:hypothetical protein